MKRCFEVVNGLWRYQNHAVEAAAIHIKNLDEQHFQTHQVILFQRLGANGEFLSEETKSNLENWICRYKDRCRFVYDIDDFLFNSQSGYPATLAKLCHYGLVPNDYLKEQMSKYQKCHVIRTHVDTDSILQTPKKVHSPVSDIHIGWFSCSANGIETIKSAIDQIPLKLKSRLKFHLFCDVVFHDLVKKVIPDTCLNIYPMVSPSEMYSNMLSMQILINPLTLHCLHEERIGVKQDDFPSLMQGKSEVKYALAGACSIPLIVTPVDSYQKVIKHKVNGLFADTPQEWAEGIIYLAEQPQSAQEIGRKSFEDVIKNYSLQRASKDYADFFLQITG
jgi:glycosyltransferase involved in cell wall biosynthesis